MHAKAIKKLKKAVKKSNKAFEVATPAEKRVLIAKDALRLIRGKKIKVKQGAFLSIPRAGAASISSGFGYGLDVFGEPTRDSEVVSSEAFQKDLKRDEILENCQVCALGAILVSTCRLFNKFKPGVRTYLARPHNVDVDFDQDAGGSGNMWAYLRKYFPVANMRLIEYTFEGGHGAFGTDDIPARTTEKADALFEKHDAENRLVAILKNIIKNDGLFVL